MEFKKLIQGSHKYSYHGEKTEQFNSSEFIRLTTSEWLYTKSNTVVPPSNLSVEDLADGYDTISTEAKSLIEFLGISNPDAELNLSDEQMLAYEFGKKLLQQGVTLNDLPELLQVLLN